MGRKLISVFLMAWILLIVPMNAFAQDFDDDCVGSIAVTLIGQNGKKPIAGAELSLYYVATVNLNSNNNLSYTFVNGFKDCGFALNDPALSLKLDAFVKDYSVSSEKRVTDSQGNVTFTNLPLGLYFVKQTNAVSGYAACTSFLVTVPSKNADRYVYDVNATPKVDIEKRTDITIKKVWNTDESTKLADSVTVHLLKDDDVVKTAKLNAENDWQVTYTDMPESDAYSIKEVNIPKGFTATYKQNGYIFTVTNTSTLIQTGQLIWPIPMLLVSGIVLIAVGVVLLQKKRKSYV